VSTFNFDCPEKLAKKFWAVCVKNGDTPGHRLRELMISEIQDRDPGFVYDPDIRPMVSIAMNTGK